MTRDKQGSNVDRFHSRKTAEKVAADLRAHTRGSRSSGGRRIDYVARRTANRIWHRWQVIERGSQR